MAHKFTIFVLVLWGRIGFDSESVIQCQHAERCGEALKYLVVNNN